jgi:GLPGLI family protein
MKKISIIILIFSVLFSINSFSGNTKGNKPTGFQGSITYKISYTGRELTTQEETQMPNKMIKYYANFDEVDKIVMPMGYYFTITNRETKEFTIVYDMMGQKFYSQWVKDSTDNKDKPEIIVSKLDETKTIAGYKCKKAVITVKSKEKDQITTVFYTEDFKPSFPDEDYNIDGIILETEVLLGDADDDEALTMVSTATEVVKGKVKKSEYEIPAGATKYEKEQLKALFGGQVE